MAAGGGAAGALDINSHAAPRKAAQRGNFETIVFSEAENGRILRILQGRLAILTEEIRSPEKLEPARAVAAGGGAAGALDINSHAAPRKAAQRGNFETIVFSEAENGRILRILQGRLAILTEEIRGICISLNVIFREGVEM